MKSFQQIFTEAELPKENDSKTEIEKMIKNIWKEVMPKSKLSLHKSNLGTNNYSIFSGYIGNDKSEFTNGIIDNDPLRFSFEVTNLKDKFIVEFNRDTLSIKPTEKHMAYGRKKLKLRKMTVKSKDALEKKMKQTFEKVKNSIKDSIENGDFEVYSKEIQDMIKSKV